jgi:hypothetical protein
MTQHDVAAAIDRLRAEGKAASVQNLRRQLGYGSIRDIVRLRNQLAAQPDAVPAEAVPPAPVLGEKPIGQLCWRCGRGVWHERVIGEWVCITCGVFPAI